MKTKIYRDVWLMLLALVFGGQLVLAGSPLARAEAQGRLQR